MNGRRYDSTRQVTENGELDAMLILPEHAACAGDRCPPDAFKLNEKLGRLLMALQAKQTQPPLAVALTGDWGTGKSSAMHWLESKLRSTSEGTFETCWFKPWKYQSREAVLSGLLAVVIASVKPAGGLIQIGSAGAIALVDGVLKSVTSIKGTAGSEVGLGGGLFGAMMGAKRTYQEILEPQRLYSNEFEIALKDALKRHLGEAKRLVIFIDDLDRCLPEVAIQVLEAIKLFFDQAQVIFILGADRDIVDRMMVQHYFEALKPSSPQEAAHVARKARQYLDKMFQIEVQVPPTDEQVAAFAESQVKQIAGWGALADEHQKRLVPAVRAVAGINPRGVIRALNSAFIGAGHILKLIDDTEKSLNEAKTFRGDQKNREEEAQALLINLRSALAQAIQRRLVEAVLSGAEVAALASRPESVLENTEDGEAVRPAEWHGLARHARGRAFLRAWSLAVQGEGAQYLRPDQIAVVPGPFMYNAKSSEPAAGEESIDLNPMQPVLDSSPESLRQIQQILQLQSVAERFKALAPLLTVSALGFVLSVVEFPADDVGNSAETDFLALLRPIARALAHARQVDEASIVLEDLRAETVLDLTGSQITDEELAGLTKLPNLTHLILARTPIRGASKLADLLNLRILNLSGTDISDFSDLATLENLQELDLSDTGISDFSKLAEFTKLQKLNLSGTGISDISHLQPLTKLEHLSLQRTRIWDISQVKNFANLKILGLNGTRVHDVSCLTALTKLQSAGLAFTQITDVHALSELKELKMLTLEGTSISNVSSLSQCPKLFHVVLPSGKVWNPREDRVPKL